MENPKVDSGIADTLKELLAEADTPPVEQGKLALAVDVPVTVKLPVHAPPRVTVAVLSKLASRRNAPAVARQIDKNKNRGKVVIRGGSIRTRFCS